VHHLDAGGTLTYLMPAAVKRMLIESMRRVSRRVDTPEARSACVVVAVLGALQAASCAGQTEDGASRTNSAVCATDGDCATGARCVSGRCMRTNSSVDASLFADSSSAGHGGSAGSGGSVSTGSAGGAGGVDASASECVSGTYPLSASLDSSRRCFASLPAGVDIRHTVIQTGLGTPSAMNDLDVRRDDSPCGTKPAFRVVDARTIEICGLCVTNLGLAFRASVDCSSVPPEASTDAAPADACARKTVSVQVVRDDRGCTIDLPPNVDRSVPLATELPLGIFGGGGIIKVRVGYQPTPSCDDAQNTGWQPVAGSSTLVRLCEGVCQAPINAFDATLVCGAG